MVEATREGIQMYGQRTQFVDPTEWVLQSYPWPASSEWTQHLSRVRPQDVNYSKTNHNNSTESESLAQSSSDPLVSHILLLAFGLRTRLEYS